jgi:6-pyruvoyltetrahydropterin/6-carboxytetrahydropterin synthase
VTWRLSKVFRFEAAHQLVDHDGKCARLHGHSWRMTVTVEGDQLQEHAPEPAPRNPKVGMLVDFAAIKAVVEPIVDGFLDHHHLNESLPDIVPTSEGVARWVFDIIARRIADLGVRLVAVRVDETCTSACEYTDRVPVFNDAGVVIGSIDRAAAEEMRPDLSGISLGAVTVEETP